MQSGIKILGTGCFEPDLIVSNSDFSHIAKLETDDEWITSRTGIRQRRFCQTTNLDMMTRAAKAALENAGVSPDEIDAIIVSTATPQFFYPSMSCLVQNTVGVKNAFAIDVHAACTGFVNALDIARNYLSLPDTGVKKALVVAGEMLSNQADFTDRSTCVLFGDGAGAVVIERAAHKQYSCILGAKGEDFGDIALYCKVPYARNSPFPSADNDDSYKPYLQMDGKAVYKFASDIMPRMVKAVCEKAGLALSDIDLLIPHQANIRIIKSAMRNLDIPDERVYVNIHDTGNISSACIPVCLDELSRANRLKSGMKVCLVAFGAGLTFGSIILEI
ncbi:MAG: ketoacyl-ACP synthase III [Oscillospiraceae bacterium]|nr:ketoacyl-ACP synthase III [Oscillospiraceae bacterium]